MRAVAGTVALLYAIIQKRRVRVAVPRYYFDIMDATRSVPDEAGLDCRDLDEAHRQACTLIADAMTGPEATRIDWCAWRVEVCDEGHGLVFTVPFPAPIG